MTSMIETKGEQYDSGDNGDWGQPVALRINIKKLTVEIDRDDWPQDMIDQLKALTQGHVDLAK